MPHKQGSIRHRFFLSLPVRLFEPIEVFLETAGGPRAGYCQLPNTNPAKQHWEHTVTKNMDMHEKNKQEVAIAYPLVQPPLFISTRQRIVGRVTVYRPIGALLREVLNT